MINYQCIMFNITERKQRDESIDSAEILMLNSNSQKLNHKSKIDKHGEDMPETRN
jgi:hypothetical protein